MQRRLFLLLAVLLILAGVSPVWAQFYGQDQTVNGYTRRDGTYVQPYHRTMPDHNPFNNYSTRGNVNPWTGQMGTVNPYNQPMAPMQSNPYGRQQRRF
jgi:hypothetical protein